MAITIQGDKLIMSNPDGTRIETNLPSDGSLFLIGGSNDPNPDLAVRRGNKIVYLGAKPGKGRSDVNGVLSQLGINKTDLQLYSTDIGMGLTKGGEESNPDYFKPFTQNIAPKQELNTQYGTGQIPSANYQDVIAAANRLGVTPPTEEQWKSGNISSDIQNEVKIAGGQTETSINQENNGVNQGAGNTNNGLITVTKNGTSMTINPANLKTWTDAGWTQSGEGGTSAGAGSGTGTATTTETTFDRNTALNFLKGMGLPQTQIDMIMGVVDKFDFGDAIDSAEILKKFNEISTNVIDPYYQEQIDTFKKDLEIEVAREQGDYEKLQQLNDKKAQATIRQTQGNLEASGMSRAGESAYQLGQYSTYGNQYGEGVIPKEIQRIAESSRSDYLRGLENLGRTAEKQLGSSNLGSLVPNYTPQGGITGKTPYQWEGSKAGLLAGLSGQQDLMTTYRSMYT